MCSASKPKVEHSAPPPMLVPEAQDEQVQRRRDRERQRAASAYGRESTILGGPASGAPGGPTAQANTLLGG
jgi:hypothetical protein